MVSEERKVDLCEWLLEYARALDGASEKNLNTSDEGGHDLLVLSRGEKIFLVVEKKTEPLRIEIRCDYRLGKTLQERYESVMQSRSLGRNGIKIVCSGQLADDELRDLVRHSYEISTEE